MKPDNHSRRGMVSKTLLAAVMAIFLGWFLFSLLWQGSSKKRNLMEPAQSAYANLPVKPTPRYESDPEMVWRHAPTPSPSPTP